MLGSGSRSVSRSSILFKGALFRQKCCCSLKSGRSVEMCVRVFVRDRMLVVVLRGIYQMALLILPS